MLIFWELLYSAGTEFTLPALVELTIMLVSLFSAQKYLWCRTNHATKPDLNPHFAERSEARSLVVVVS